LLRGLIVALVCLPALAQEPITVTERRMIALAPAAQNATRKLHLTLAKLEDTGWEGDRILDAAREAGSILAQCGIALESAELVQVRAPERHRDFLTPVSRELARAVPLPRPVIWFVRDTRQRPAFDAEAIGRGNSRTRPELADSVWVTRATRDLGIALAHELAHVLMDSGEHSSEPGNLMRAETSPANTALTAGQCERLRDTATANGLLQTPAWAGQGPR
jgi:hypothetical protein